MIICHNDPDGFSAAGIFLLTGQEKLDNLRYSTVTSINKMLRKLLYNEYNQDLYLIDINADDSDTFFQTIIQLKRKGNSLTVFDHHQFSESYDAELSREGVTIIRDSSVSCSELLYKNYSNKIKDKRKAEFLMCMGAIGDRMITPFVQKIINSFRREEIFDVYAYLLAGISNGKKFLYEILEEKDIADVGFTKKLYYRAAKQRFWIEKLKAKINILKESTGSISTIHIFQPHIGFASSYLIDQDNTNFAIAIGDGLPALKYRVWNYFLRILKFIFHRTSKRKNDIIRISFRSKVPINNLVSSFSKKYRGFGGGHKYACGCSIPKEYLIPFLKEIIYEFKKL